MSQFNQTTPQTTQNNPRKGNTIIYWVVILILLIACVFLVLDRNKKSEENKVTIDQKNQTIDSISSDRANLQKDFDAASLKMDQLVSQNSKLDSALQSDNAALTKMRAQINTILHNSKATKEELAKARQMITMLGEKTKEYETRIAELEKENTQLTGENKQLAKERDSTVEKNIALKKVGSVLHASNIRMDAIHKRKNGKEKETSKAKRVDELRITFDIDENRIAESGTKQLYLRIVAPNGNVLSTPSNASGMMTTVNGNQVAFSVVKNIMLTQNQPVNNVTVDWQQDGDYAKGTYYIEIYSEGYKVGSGNVALR